MEELVQAKQQQKKKVDFDLAQFKGDERAEMDLMYSETLKNFTEGSIVVGRVLSLRDNEVLMDIGYKSEGAIPVSEFRHAGEIKPGDEFEVLLEQIEDEHGMVVLSKEKADEKRLWDRVLSTYEEGVVLEGIIKTRVRGGAIVDVDGVEAFLPGSQIDVMPVHNLDSYIGGKYEFRVLKVNAERRNIILSRRKLIEERMQGKRKELLETLEKGQMRKGRVKNITDFGVFVDLDGMDGLLHITDMSWGRIKHPSEMVAVGDDLEVVILDVDRSRERVSLGLKQAQPNPWDGIEERYPVGSRLRGKVVNLAPYGAFVEIEKGVEGLVHVSEISWTKRIARASDVLALGDEVDVAVLSVNREAQKMALGIRQTEDNPWDTVQERYPVGSRIKGIVRNFTSYGAFVEMEEGIDGMIHVSDMSWTRKVGHPSEVMEKGQTVEAVVLEVNADTKHISLGMKQAQADPWTTIATQYKPGQLVKGKVSKLATFGAFVEIGEGVDGLVHISQISDEHVEKAADLLKPGQEVEARIVKIDLAERRIGLSIKAASMPEEEFVQQQETAGAEGLMPGEHMVDLAGAFDQALGEEWRPGQKKEEKSDAAE
jgi:small subunit ribosomal protein S1